MIYLSRMLYLAWKNDENVLLCSVEDKCDADMDDSEVLIQQDVAIQTTLEVQWLEIKQREFPVRTSIFPKNQLPAV